MHSCCHQRFLAAFLFTPFLSFACSDGSSGLVQESIEPGTIFLSPTLSEAEVEDLRFIAQERGWTMDETVQRIAWQRHFDETIEHLRERYPNVLSGAVITTEGPHQAWIGFAGALPEDVPSHPILSQLDVEYAEHLGYSEAELHAQQLEVHHAIRGAGYPDVVSAYDVETGLIEVSLGLGQQSAEASVVIASLPASSRADNVIIDVVASHPESLHVLSGGGHTSSCTAGFTVRSGSTRGVTVAGHCGNAQRMLDNSNTWRTLTFQREHLGSWGDWQWHTRPGDTFNSFFQYDSGRRRDTWRVGTTSKGRTVCRYGKTTGRHCDEVRKMNVSARGEDRLVMMKNDKASGGDSGGPWYYGNTAYGTHKGSKWAWFKSRDVWSQMRYVDEALGVFAIVCQPPRTTCYSYECGSVPIGCGRTIYCGSCGGGGGECESPLSPRSLQEPCLEPL